MSQNKNINILVLNGPNLNLLGTRKPEIYGNQTLEDVVTLLKEKAASHGVGVTFKQSNHEGDLIDYIQQAKNTIDGIIINAGGYSHTSIAIRDALEAVEIPTYEVHVSDVTKREDFRKKSFISDVALGMICGKGINGYAMAFDKLVRYIRENTM